MNTQITLRIIGLPIHFLLALSFGIYFTLDLFFRLATRPLYQSIDEFVHLETEESFFE
jgi:hypothetical protein